MRSAAPSFIVSFESRGHSANPIPTSRGQQISWQEAVRSAVLLGVVSALGFSIGLGFGLPRDYWIVLTVLIAVRPTLSLTLSFTTTMAIGTIIGAVIAAAITLETNEIPVLLSLLFVFAVLMFATRGVNVGIVQVFFTAFIIILVNIIYPGEWYLALYRILEVAIGIVLAITAVYLLSVMKRKTEPKSRISG